MKDIHINIIDKHLIINRITLITHNHLLFLVIQYLNLVLSLHFHFHYHFHYHFLLLDLQYPYPPTTLAPKLKNLTHTLLPDYFLT